MHCWSASDSLRETENSITISSICQNSTQIVESVEQKGIVPSVEHLTIPLQHTSRQTSPQIQAFPWSPSIRDSSGNFQNSAVNKAEIKRDWIDAQTLFQSNGSMFFGKAF